jgi:hypothetical protein
MTGTGFGNGSRMGKHNLPLYGLILTTVLTLFATGCLTTDGASRESGGVKPSMDQAVEKAGGTGTEDPGPLTQGEQIARLKTREKELEKEVRDLNARLKASMNAQDVLEGRLEIAQTAREEAVREVVRIRARIQGMASNAEASAMFAEARVILDRMEEDAFSAQALEDLDLARTYMDQGKDALDKGNPGGAAYLFDFIPALYEGMKKADPRTVKVSVSIAALRKSPESSSSKIGNLYWGNSATGLEKRPGWIKIRTPSGQTGWLMKSQVQ